MSELRQKLRKQFIALRDSLSIESQEIASESLVRLAKEQKLFNDSKHVAIYLSHKGEINTRPLIEHLWQLNISVCVPVIHPFSKGHLLFLRYHQGTFMQVNQYGISEPVLDLSQVIPINKLDIIFTPLVAFDAHGNRLGMGGGYYDRSLATINHNKCKVIGLAHDCQFTEHLPTEAWDIPLPYILTNKQYYCFE